MKADELALKMGTDLIAPSASGSSSKTDVTWWGQSVSTKAASAHDLVQKWWEHIKSIITE
jgi:hypothetical protein